MFDNINKFERIFLIFTGNSINEIEERHWEKLKYEATIGINHTFKIFHPTYLFFADKDVLYAVWNWYNDKKVKPIIYCRERAIYKKPDPDRYPELIPYAWVKNHIDETWNEKETQVHKDKPYGLNMNITPCWLFSILHECGYTGNVYMLGADFYIEDDKYHFHNYHRNYYAKRKYENKLQEFKKFFESPYWDNKLKLFNCNPKSGLTKFPKVNLDDIL